MEDLVTSQRTFFKTNATLNYEFRLNNLTKLKTIIQDNETLILNALKADLNKEELEAYSSEVGFVLQELSETIKKLKHYMKDEKVKTNLINFPAKSYLRSSPYGVVLIIAPWNYPFHLTIAPLVGAIAAGNTCILRPSEYSTNTSKIIEKLINNNFDASYLHVVLGDHHKTSEIMSGNIDYVFFTGSPYVGKIIGAECAKKLIPYSLELGGKCPCIVNDYDLDLAAKRIIYGKMLNAGQTCVAVDYILVKEQLHDKLLAALISEVKRQYSAALLDCNFYPKIINEKHYKRLIELIGESKNIVYGGKYKNQTIELTIIDNPRLDSKLMQQEIFGPLLPIITYKTIAEAKQIISKNPNPLALYLFSNDAYLIDDITKTVMFGGATINDTIMHITNFNLPFGGVKSSGFGSYHGKYSYLAFSKQKAILKKGKHEFPYRYIKDTANLKTIKKILK